MWLVGGLPVKHRLVSALRRAVVMAWAQFIPDG